jgi:hypothetical protein
MTNIFALCFTNKQTTTYMDTPTHLPEDIELIRELLRLRTTHASIKARYMALYACSLSTFNRRYRLALSGMQQQAAEEQQAQALRLAHGMDFHTRRLLLEDIAAGRLQVQKYVLVKGALVEYKQLPTVKERLAALAELNRMANGKTAREESRELSNSLARHRTISHLEDHELEQLRSLMAKLQVVEENRDHLVNTGQEDWQDMATAHKQAFIEDMYHGREAAEAEAAGAADELYAGAPAPVFTGSYTMQELLEVASENLNIPSQLTKEEKDRLLDDIEAASWEHIRDKLETEEYGEEDDWDDEEDSYEAEENEDDEDDEDDEDNDDED